MRILNFYKKSAVVHLGKREDGVLSSRCFARRIGGSEALIMRLREDKLLSDDWDYCPVETVSFNSDGMILASGFLYNPNIKLWDWDAGTVKLRFRSDHKEGVTQAKFMPFADDVIITAGDDGLVYQSKISEGGEVYKTFLGNHFGCVRKLAIEPGSSCIFYSCGQDGRVNLFDLRIAAHPKSLRLRNNNQVVSPRDITIDPTQPNQLVVGGDDEYARVYDIRRCNWNASSDIGQPVKLFCPAHLIGKDVEINGLAFSHHGELLISYWTEDIYLFQKGQELGADPLLGTNSGPRVFENGRNKLEDNQMRMGLSFFGPNCDYVASGSDCHRLFIWRKSNAELLRATPGDSNSCIASHPCATVLATSGGEEGFSIWIPNSRRPASPVNYSELNHHVNYYDPEAHGVHGLEWRNYYD